MIKNSEIVRNAEKQTSSHLGQNVILNFGPQHPAAHGVLRLILELDGEVITNFQSEYITSSL